jgi:hypothetical protein
MLFAIFVDSYSIRPEDRFVGRNWFVRHDSNGNPVLAREFDRAAKVPIEEAVAIYKRWDSPLRKLGLVPVE